MTKTIEEAAKKFADMKTTKQAGSSVERDKKALLMTQFFRYALEEVPLSERLTAEEKERVRKIYVECELIEMDDSPNLPADRITEAGAKMQVLDSIFGADFFKEGE